MPSLSARLMRRAMRATMKPRSSGDGVIDETRRRIDRGLALTMLGRRVGHRPVADGELGATRGEWIGVPAARRHVLYLHGGYYVAGHPRSYRNIAARLAAGLDADVLLLDYRLAPEHPYPAAVLDAVTAYRGVLESGADPASLAVVGDSAGGGLALALMLRAESEGLPLPAAAALLSPWTDLTCRAPSVDRNDRADDVVSAPALRAAAQCYAGPADPRDPALSPLFGDLSGLPPLFVTVDSSEVLVDDATTLAQRAVAAGTRCQLHTGTGLLHIWPVLVPYVREARATVAEAVAFLDRELA